MVRSETEVNKIILQQVYGFSNLGCEIFFIYDEVVTSLCGTIHRIINRKTREEARL